MLVPQDAPAPHPAAAVTLWRRAVAAPSSVSRATRRLTHAAALTANVVSCIHRLEGRRARGLDADRERIEFLQWLADNLCAIHGIRVTMERDPAARDAVGSPAVIVANHISYIDPLAILARVPAFSIAKREVSRWPLLGPVATQLGMVPYARGDVFDGARVLRRCERVLARGHRILGFPEGTTTYGHGVAEFHRGMFYLARRSGVPVIPVALRYRGPEAAWVGDATFVPHYVRTTMRPVTEVRLRVLEPLAPGRYGSPEALAGEARRSIARALLPS